MTSEFVCLLHNLSSRKFFVGLGDILKKRKKRRKKGEKKKEGNRKDLFELEVMSDEDYLLLCSLADFFPFGDDFSGKAFWGEGFMCLVNGWKGLRRVVPVGVLLWKFCLRVHPSGGGRGGAG